MFEFLSKLQRNRPMSTMACDMGPPPLLPDNTPQERILIGLDLGEVKDYTALSALQMTKHPTDAGGHARRYTCRLLLRWPLHTAYETIIEHVHAIALNLPMPPELVIDTTGAGRPVAQMFRKARLPIKRFVPVIITGGTKVIQEPDGYWHVAKGELVSCVLAAMQSGRLKVSPQLKECQTLIRDLQRFRRKINISTHNESFEAWRTRDHDDTVLATALAVGYGEHFGRGLGAEHFVFG